MPKDNHEELLGLVEHHAPGAAVTVAQEGVDLRPLLIDRVQDYAIFALDRTGHILSWNLGAERLTGYRLDEILGKHFSIFYPPEDLVAGKPEQGLEIASATGHIDDEGWRVRKDGTRFWANVVITALRDDNGQLLGFAKLTRDLTDRRLSDEALRRSEEQFRLIVQSVKDYAIFMLDPAGHIATWNEGAQRIKGYTTAEIVGKHFSKFYPAEDIRAGKPEHMLEMAAASGHVEDEGWRIRKDGSRFWANVVITALRDEHGELIGFAKVTRDLSERRLSEERAIADARRLAAEEAARSGAEHRARELRNLAEQLRASAMELERRSAEAESANRVKSEFLAAMSHELRTPLNAIGGYVQLLEMEISGPLTDDQRAHLTRIQRSQQHLLGVINDILNFSRIEAGQLEYDIRPVHLEEVVSSVLPMIAPQAAAKRVRLDQGSQTTATVARADGAKVEQILLNLLSNAVKFTPPGGEIELNYGARNGRAWIAVRDTGIGIPSDQLQEIFAPFVQVGRGLAAPKEGTGLGLSISRELARGMSGDLVAQSEEGAGSTFTLTLPVA